MLPPPLCLRHETGAGITAGLLLLSLVVVALLAGALRVPVSVEQDGPGHGQEGRITAQRSLIARHKAQVAEYGGDGHGPAAQRVLGLVDEVERGRVRLVVLLLANYVAPTSAHLPLTAHRDTGPPE